MNRYWIDGPIWIFISVSTHRICIYEWKTLANKVQNTELDREREITALESFGLQVEQWEREETRVGNWI